MRLSGVAIALTALALLAFPPRPARAQYQPPSEKLLISGTSAATWSEDGAEVIQVEGPVSIELDRAKLVAKQAVIWLTSPADAPRGQQQATIVLIGDAKLEQAEAVRSGPRLSVTAAVSGRIQIVAGERLARDLSDTPLYRAAAEVRQRLLAQPRPMDPVGGPDAAPAAPPDAGPAPGAPATVAPGSVEPVRMHFGAFATDKAEGKVVAILTGGVTLFQRRKNGDIMELQSDRAVVFTPLDSLEDAANSGRIKSVENAVTAVYLEGDVRITMTPKEGPMGEQRFRARRVYYEFATDRAVLTDAVVHTVEPTKNIPVVIRAKTVRQLSQGEFRADGVELSTSSFALPSYSIASDRIYVRQVDTGNPRLGNRVTFNARNARLNVFGVPLFYLPFAGGSMTDRGSPLRGLGVENSSRYGTGVRTEWGLFETLGMVAPEDLDASYRLDYLSDRGPAGGLDANYRGGFVTDTTKERWSFEGELESYFVYDKGFDTFGRLSTRLEEDAETRGRAMWQHQHFFPDNWQAQLRAGYVSDPTFLEAWFEREFNERLPHDVSAYFKRQVDTEAFTLLFNFQPNDIVTTSDLMQEQFEVEHLPELAYHRVGDSAFDGRATLFSNNRLSGLRFNQTSATLREQGFPQDGSVGPGIPSLGQTGTPSSVTYRGDFRQEIDFPFSAGPFRVVPYLIGRYTAYSDSPAGGAKHRLFAGAGARVTTAFWKVHDSVRSRLFDLYRMRHVIEPELNVFTAGQTEDRNDLFIYEERADPVNDASAVQLAFRQRWQTYRGAPGRRRSVDFFSLNLEGNFFANQPDEGQLSPRGFRGLFFPSLPETSVPRNAINADANWRISDTTALLADAQYNLDRTELATASIGLVVRRDERVSYFLGNRYINELNSNITSFSLNYELTRKYRLAFSQNLDFGRGENVSSGVELQRRFDTFFMSFKASYNLTDDQSAIGFNIYPAGLGYGVESDQLRDAFTEN